MAPDGLSIRAARREDLPAVAALLDGAFDSYREWAPTDWQPRFQDDESRLVIEWILGRPETWYVVAEDPAGHAGQCGFHPAHEQRLMRGDPVPGTVQFWHLFVRRDLWGGGLAGRLHDLALAEIRARGYSRARLITPAAHHRARRFYARRGWRESPAPVTEPGRLGLDLVQYEIDV